MTGYFINTNNYLPCEHCRQGFDKITMLCTEPYYKHFHLTSKRINLVGVAT